MTTLNTLRIAAQKVHEEVCDLHYDHSMMRDGICDTCADDYHEAQIMARPVKASTKNEIMVAAHRINTDSEARKQILALIPAKTQKAGA